MTLIAREQPRGHAVRTLRGQRTREEFAERLHVTAAKVKNWENEKRGALMPEETWLLARITFDPLAREQWDKRRPRDVRRLARYTCGVNIFDEAEHDPDPNGEWVRWDDVVRL